MSHHDRLRQPAGKAIERAAGHGLRRAALCCLALAILGLAPLGCGNTKSTAARVSPPSPESLDARERSRRENRLRVALRPIASDKQRMLYLAQFGDRVQLRLRVFPFPGSEGLLWESPAAVWGNLVYQPSPSFTRVAIAWWDRLERPRVFVVPVGYGEPEELPEAAEFVWWHDDDTLRLLTEGGVESSYDLRTKRVAVVRKHVDVLARLEELHATPIRVVEQLADSGALPLRLRKGEARSAVLLGIGFPPFIPLVDSAWLFPSAVAALSPDGRYLALTSARAGALFICRLQEANGSVTGCSVVKEIALPELVSREHVSAHHLRWSADSKHLTFTEHHSHPAGPQFADRGLRDPAPLHSTELVRTYSLTPNGGELTTLAAGRNAFLMPSPWEGQLEEPGGPLEKSRTRAANCRGFARRLLTAVRMYTGEAGGCFPPASSWDEALVPVLRSLRRSHNLDVESLPPCPERSAEDEGSYAFNSALSTLSPRALRAPKHTVVIFESDAGAGWDAAGGPELLPDEPRHMGGDNYGFADGHVEWLARKKRPDGTWAKAPDADSVIWDPVLKEGEEGAGR